MTRQDEVGERADAAFVTHVTWVLQRRCRPSGRGIGSGMTWQPLYDACAAGCDLGALQAAEAGAGLYRRLGSRPFGGITEYKPNGGNEFGAAVETGRQESTMG